MVNRRFLSTTRAAIGAICVLALITSGCSGEGASQPRKVTALSDDSSTDDFTIDDFSDDDFDGSFDDDDDPPTEAELLRDDFFDWVDEEFEVVSGWSWGSSFDEWEIDINIDLNLQTPEEAITYCDPFSQKLDELGGEKLTYTLSLGSWVKDDDGMYEEGDWEDLPCE